MEETIHTLQEFMLHTETITYIIMAISLVAVLGFWLFLNERDEN
jgi:hypothetical protein